MANPHPFVSPTIIMPSSFKHADTSPTNPPRDGGELTSAYPALVDDPCTEPATASVEAIDMAKKVDGAYSSISGANREFQRYESSRSLNIANKSGESIRHIDRIET